jgi:SH3 domain protein
MPIRTLLIAALCCSSAAAFADTAYVTDSLRLGIHAAEDTSDTPFDNLVSGTAVEVVERKAAFAHVRLGDGREGWVKAAFLVPGKPARALVTELQARIDALETELATAKSTLAGQIATEARATGPAVAAESAAAIESTIERLRSDARRYEEQLEDYRYSAPLWLAGGLAVAALAGGFAAGIWWIDLRIRRRHGGFRIY